VFNIEILAAQIKENRLTMLSKISSGQINDNSIREDLIVYEWIIRQDTFTGGISFSKE